MSKVLTSKSLTDHSGYSFLLLLILVIFSKFIYTCMSTI